MRQSTLDMDDLRNRRSLVITRKEAAEALGVDPRTITTSINEGTIPHVKLGRRIVIPREKFLALFADTAPDRSWEVCCGGAESALPRRVPIEMSAARRKLNRERRL